MRKAILVTGLLCAGVGCQTTSTGGTGGTGGNGGAGGTPPEVDVELSVADAELVATDAARALMEYSRDQGYPVVAAEFYNEPS
jgi:hypothetical protein